MLSGAETLISLSDARKLPLLRRNGGKSPDISTLVRWALRGVRGRKLQTILVGGRRFTSAEAVARFVAGPHSSQAPSLPTPRPGVQDADTYLRKEGL